ncbi:hypothetical protein KCH_54070 [Kitasatospora cheerisanensis KCTC 2395]|uniref:Uncharacterized protein n=1 Tax=Kitasatospora cheerisanensis KCTC 2395 TaxID=1348663 RepID=A0A066YMU9_9ACTN|nr:hypothetical protein KCH_54070 [Kitasatospora cheerisanensis KCTC 2395]
MTADDRTTKPSLRPGHLPVRLRGPADMAEMLPYLLGFFPDDSLSSQCVQDERAAGWQGNGKRPPSRQMPSGSGATQSSCG